LTEFFKNQDVIAYFEAQCSNYFAVYNIVATLRLCWMDFVCSNWTIRR